MFDADKIKGVIFDYGGTIDSNGMHWAEVIWMAYRAEKVPVSKDAFRDAYVYGERTLGKNPIVKPHHTFLDMLRLKMDLQVEWLKTNGFIPEAYAKTETKQRLADWCYAYARNSINAARPIIDALSKKYPVVLVSNFYGNIHAVLKDFDLDGYFPSVIESAVVGIRKPDPAIFALGINALSLEARDVVVIGDSYNKDIVPATKLGCQTVWLKSIGWNPYKGDETADYVISDFKELREVLGLTR